MPLRGYGNRSYKRIIRRTRRKFKRLPNVKQIRFFTPRNVATAARYAIRGVNMMKGIINSELHRGDVEVNVTPNTTAAIALLTDINQGDDVNNRNGNSILAKYISVRASCAINNSATATMVRFIVFVDGDNDGQTPTAAELLTTPTSILSTINPDYSARFTILYDKHFTLSINGDRVMIDKFYKSLNFHIKYITGTGSTGFGRNNIWVYTISSEATNTPNLNIYSRIAWYDN